MRVDSPELLQGMSGTAHDLANRLNCLALHLELARSALSGAQLTVSERRAFTMVEAAQRGVKQLGNRTLRFRQRVMTALRENTGVEVPRGVSRQVAATHVEPVVRGGAVFAAIMHRQIESLERTTARALDWLEIDRSSPGRHPLAHAKLDLVAATAKEMLRAKEELARLTDGSLAPCEVDLQSLAQRAWELLGVQISSTARAKWSFADVRPILGVPSLVLDAFLNLIINAHDAVTGCPEKLIELRLFQDGERAIFEVKDSGTGLPPGDVSRLFEPFFTTKRHGTGHGLERVMRMAKACGGEVVARPAEDSAAPYRTVFQIALPTL